MVPNFLSIMLVTHAIQVLPFEYDGACKYQWVRMYLCYVCSWNQMLIGTPWCHLYSKVLSGELTLAIITKSSILDVPSSH